MKRAGLKGLFVSASLTLIMLGCACRCARAGQPVRDMTPQEKKRILKLAQTIAECKDSRRPDMWMLQFFRGKTAFAFPTLKKGLIARNPWSRLWSARALLLSGGDPKQPLGVVEKLLECEDKSGDVRVKREARIVLGEVESGLPALSNQVRSIYLRGLASPKASVRYECALAFKCSRTHVEKYLPVLVEALSCGNQDFANRAKGAIDEVDRNMQQKMLSPLLLKGLSSPAPMGRLACADMMVSKGFLDPKPAIPVLGKLLGGEVQISRRAEETLVKAGKHALPVLPAVIEAIKRRARQPGQFGYGGGPLRILVHLGRDAKPAVPVLLALVRGRLDPVSRAEVLSALGSIDDGRADVLRVLRSHARDHSQGVDVQIGALEGLGNIGPKARSSVYVVIPFLGKEGQLRIVAIKTLGKIGGTESLRPMRPVAMEVLAKNRSGGWQHSALTALEAILRAGDKAAIVALFSKFPFCGGDVVRVIRRSDWENPELIAGLSTVVKGSDVQARRSALSVLSVLGSRAKAAIPALLELKRELQIRRELQQLPPVQRALDAVGHKAPQPQVQKTGPQPGVPVPGKPPATPGPAPTPASPVGPDRTESVSVREGLEPPLPPISPEQLSALARRIVGRTPDPGDGGLLLTLDKKIRTLALGCGGAYMVVGLKGQSSLMVVDVARCRIRRKLALNNAEDAVIAAGGRILLVYLPLRRRFVVYNLESMRKLYTHPFAGTGVCGLAMGFAEERQALVLCGRAGQSAQDLGVLSLKDGSFRRLTEVKLRLGDYGKNPQIRVDSGLTVATICRGQPGTAGMAAVLRRSRPGSPWTCRQLTDTIGILSPIHGGGFTVGSDGNLRDETDKSKFLFEGARLHPVHGADLFLAVESKPGVSEACLLHPKRGRASVKTYLPTTKTALLLRGYAFRSGKSLLAVAPINRFILTDYGRRTVRVLGMGLAPEPPSPAGQKSNSEPPTEAK